MKALAIGLTIFVVSAGLPQVLAQGKKSHGHMGHVNKSWRDTPEQVGLLDILEQEVQVAVQHAGLAAKDTSDLASMQRHVKHVRHAVDSTSEARGPGKGYGVIKAAQGVARHIDLAAKQDDASDNIKRHSTHVNASAENVAKWGQEVMGLTEKVLSASSASAAASALTQIVALTKSMQEGTDANGDGKVNWGPGEGGLAQAKQHMGLMAKGEGM